MRARAAPRSEPIRRIDVREGGAGGGRAKGTVLGRTPLLNLFYIVLTDFDKAFARRHKPIVTRLLPAPSPAPGRVGLEPDSDLMRFENRDDIWNISSPPSSRVVVYSHTQQTVPVIQSPAHGGSESALTEDRPAEIYSEPQQY
ncbi:hypothetical protein EVAR_34499_1 [Eumeta japonica]|uniref:Uncharacterized protein n=1 Tax=Eumeta variegata TaxID=151549 RepID=A0A4C1Z2M3_EUMVA|nr:hypothetical protein EVAR_34499_1 [Eumeta japonica]